MSKKMTFIVIAGDVYPTDTIEEIATAKQALKEAGKKEAVVFVGDPFGESVETCGPKQIVFAD